MSVVWDLFFLHLRCFDWLMNRLSWFMSLNRFGVSLWCWVLMCDRYDRLRNNRFMNWLMISLRLMIGGMGLMICNRLRMMCSIVPS